MDPMRFPLLFLIIVANGAPILGTALCRRFADYPLDGGRCWRDGRPLLGRSKTWRGLLLALIAPTIMAWFLGIAPHIGLIVGACAMAGDLLSSFTKRRLGMTTSSQALGLDQIPEALLPMLAVKPIFDLNWPVILETVVAFLILELLLSRLLYHLRVRRQPY
jgi:CDP-2,3-bis-(O-geranylgeranyl)-sn-glycerol synthase